ncbi:MAG: hypothetical protein EB127_12055 [Alphaproteobacteria bacterium]|nr:hypothetical protein [Alphaproteobacteria bacterium]
MIIERKKGASAPDANLSFISLYLFILIFFILLSKIAKHESPQSTLQKLLIPFKEQHQEKQKKNYGNIVLLDQVEVTHAGCILNHNQVCPHLASLIDSAIIYLKSNRDISHFSIKLINNAVDWDLQKLAKLRGAIGSQFDAKINLEYSVLRPSEPLYLKVLLHEQEQE